MSGTVAFRNPPARAHFITVRGEIWAARHQNSRMSRSSSPASQRRASSISLGVVRPVGLTIRASS